jgi:hypothetical protein
VSSCSANYAWGLYEIELATGDRRVLSDAQSAGQRLESPSDVLFVDADPPYALVADARALFVVELTSGARRVLSGCVGEACERIAGHGPQIFGGKLALDLDRCRVLVAHEATIYAVDLASGDRSVVSH